MIFLDKSFISQLSLDLLFLFLCNADNEVIVPEGYILIDDMILPSDSINFPSAVPINVNLWTNSRVPYLIDASLARVEYLIHKAMEEYHSKTCVQFIPRTTEKDYIQLRAGSLGCYSYIGNQHKGGQDLSLSYRCQNYGTILHELGHAIGFLHEHMRSDRDDHLIIYWGNITKGREGQFKKFRTNEDKLLNNFDVNSIMLYGELSFSKDGYNRTMEHKGGQKLYEPYEPYIFLMETNASS